MLRRVVVLGCASALCMGVSCTITGLDDWVGPTQVALDEANATITITQAVGGTKADVVATITDSHGRDVTLSTEQSVRVNGTSLVGPNQAGQYTATVDAAAAYVVTVREPTRGVEDTTLDAPGAFEITSPAAGGGASLSGFTLQWSNASELLQAEIELSETVFGTQREAALGPFSDTGSRVLRAVDLQEFVQGTELLISVAKVNRVTIAGFESGSGVVRVSASRSVTPLP